MRKVIEGSNRYYMLKVLRKHGKPMHYKQITAEVLKQHDILGKTPAMTILSILVKRKANFIRTGTGTYALRESSTV